MAAGQGLTAVADLAIVNTIIAKSGQYGSSTGGNTTGSNWIGLSSTQLTTTKAIANATEWTAASDTAPYARVAMGASGAGWTLTAFVANTGVQINNTNQLQFLGVAGTAQTLNSVLFCDALTAGNIDWFYDLSSPQAVAIGIVVQFNALTDIQLIVL